MTGCIVTDKLRRSCLPEAVRSRALLHKNDFLGLFIIKSARIFEIGTHEQTDLWTLHFTNRIFHTAENGPFKIRIAPRKEKGWVSLGRAGAEETGGRVPEVASDIERSGGADQGGTLHGFSLICIFCHGFRF